MLDFPGVLWGLAAQPALSPHLHSLQQGKSSSTGNLLDKDDLAIPPPDYSTSSRAFPSQTAGTFKQRPYSVAVPAFSQVSAQAWDWGEPGMGDHALGQEPHFGTSTEGLMLVGVWVSCLTGLG